MNRRSFFSKLVVGAAAVAVTPKILEGQGGPTGILKVDVVDIPDGMSLKQFIDEWRRSGSIIYKGPRPASHVTWKDADIAAQLELQQRQFDAIWGIPTK